MLRDYLLTIVQLTGVVQCLFIAIALLYLPDNRAKASRWLSALFIVWLVLFAHMALRQNDLEHVAPLLSFLRLPLLFLSGPLLYLYLRHVTSTLATSGWRDAVRHLLVFALVLAAYLPALTLDREGLLQTLYYGQLRALFPYVSSITATQEWLLAISRFVLQVYVIHLLVYVVLSLRLLAQHKQRVREHFSRLDKVSLDWMRNLLVALVALWISAFVSQMLFSGTGTGRMINDLQVPALVLFFSALGLFGLLQKHIPLPAHAAASPVAAPPATKYQNAAPGEEQLQREVARLRVWMQQQRPYLDSELTLVGLAAQLGLPARQLSQLINGALGQNFIDFVNGYRVEEAKRLLAATASPRPVLTIAMDVGFNSKSAFYSAFKRQTGQTPSAFRQACLSAPPGNPQPE